MAKIYKAGDPSDREVTDFTTDEFVAEEEEHGTEGEAGEGELDPEVLREAVLAEAKEEARIKVQEAYEKGLERGREAGEAQFRASIAEAAKCLESAAEAMQAAREKFIDGLEEQVVEVATLIARKVLDRELRGDTHLINTAARRALAVLADRQHVKLRVNPADLDALNAHKVTLLHDFAGLESLEVETDVSIEPGGCIAASETMEADARIETLIAEVLSALDE